MSARSHSAQPPGAPTCACPPGSTPPATPPDRIARVETACAVAAHTEAPPAAGRTGWHSANPFPGRARFERRLQAGIAQQAALLRGIAVN